MITIGVIGNKETSDIKNILGLIYQNVGLNLQFVNHINMTAGALTNYSRRSDALILSIDAYNYDYIVSNNIKFNMLIISDTQNLSTIKSINDLMPFSSDNIVIVNVDDKNFSKYTSGINAKIITFGYNNKASITPSSVTDDFGLKTVQCCIQRTFNTISGNKLYPHEFPLSFGAAGADVYSQLAAVAAALVNDVSLY